MDKKNTLSSTFKMFIDAPSQLGQLLLQAQFITEKQLQEMSAAGAAVPGRIGQLCVMAGYISHSELQDALQVQCLLREKLVDKQVALQALRLTRHRRMELRDAINAVEAARQNNAGTEYGGAREQAAEPNQRLGDLLLEAGVVDERQLEDALRRNLATGLPLGRILVLSGALSDELLVAALNAQMVLREGAVQREDAVRAIANAARKLAELPESDVQTVEQMEPLVIEPKDTFLRELLVGAAVITMEQYTQGFEKATKEHTEIGQALIALQLIDQPLLSMAREMQRLVDEKFLDALWCVDALRKAFQQRTDKGSAATAKPPDGSQRMEATETKPQRDFTPTDSFPSAKEPDHDMPGETRFVEIAPQLNLADFLVLCKAASRDEVDRARKLCAGTDFDIGSALVRTRILTPSVLEIAEHCFNLVCNAQMTLDEAVYSFEFCNRQVHQNQIPLTEATEQLAFQSGIWALHDALTAID